MTPTPDSVDSHLRCGECGAAWISPVLREMHAAGARCLVCDGELAIVSGPPPDAGRPAHERAAG